MNEVFSVEYELAHPYCADKSKHVFTASESGDGGLGVASGDAWVHIPPEAYELLHNWLRQQIDANHKPPFMSSEVETQPVPADVARLVIAAREAWEDATDSDKLAALENALEPFSDRVPYSNGPEPEAMSEIGDALDKPTNPDTWHHGNGNLPDRFIMAMLLNNPAAHIDIDDLEMIARRSGPVFTRRAIDRLMPGALAEAELIDGDLPF